MDSEIIKKIDKFFSPYPSYEFKKGDMLIQAGVEPTGIFYIDAANESFD